MPQYFDNDDAVKSHPTLYSASVLGRSFTFESDAGVFSKAGLDDGSRLLLETIAKTDLGTNILDLGCGVGPIGLILASFDPARRLVLADVSRRALDLARKNAASLGLSDRVEVVESDVYSGISSTFDCIVTNPPIRAGKKVTYAMYAGALSHLNEGGRLILVIRTKQGAESCFAYLQTLFGKVECAKQKKGYRILIATK